MQKWWMKACPKCQGDLFEDGLLRDWEIKCLQCGYVMPQDQSLAPKARSTSVRRVAGMRPVEVPRAA